MPYNKYLVLPNARMRLFFDFYRFEDLKTIDFSTAGHGITNLGEIPYLCKRPVYKDEYTLALDDLDIVFGAKEKLEQALEEILLDERTKHVFLMQSALTATIGTDVQGLADAMAAKYGIDVFTLPVRLNDDFYRGEEMFYDKLADYVGNESVSEREGINLIGDSFSDWNLRKHDSIRKKIEEDGETINIDSLRLVRLSDLPRLCRAKRNVVCSQSALGLAKALKERFGIDYDFFAEERQKKWPVKAGAVVYGNVDLLSYLQARLEGENLTLLSSHPVRNGRFASLDVNLFVERFRDDPRPKLTYAELSRFVRGVVPVSALGRDYDSFVEDVYNDEGLRKIIGLV